MEDGLPGGRAGSGEDGLREAGAAEDHVERGWVDGWVVVQGTAAGVGVSHGQRRISKSDGDGKFTRSSAWKKASASTCAFTQTRWRHSSVARSYGILVSSSRPARHPAATSCATNCGGGRESEKYRACWFGKTRDRRKFDLGFGRRATRMLFSPVMLTGEGSLGRNSQ